MYKKMKNIREGEITTYQDFCKAKKKAVISAAVTREILSKKICIYIGNTLKAY